MKKKNARPSSAPLLDVAVLGEAVDGDDHEPHHVLAVVPPLAVELAGEAVHVQGVGAVGHVEDELLVHLKTSHDVGGGRRGIMGAGGRRRRRRGGVEGG